MVSKIKISELISTFFYIGKIKYCPGTFGSIAAFPLCYLIGYGFIKTRIVFLFDNLSVIESQILTLIFAALFICLCLFILGTWTSSIYASHIKAFDPKEIVIDEVVGQMLTVILSFFSILFVNSSNLALSLNLNILHFLFLFLMPFILFRFFDIIKPWPINLIDKNIKGGIGIMLDDVLAAIFATIAQYAITFVLIN